MATRQDLTTTTTYHDPIPTQAYVTGNQGWMDAFACIQIRGIQTCETENIQMFKQHD
jgi:hypothetical protein